MENANLAGVVNYSRNIARSPRLMVGETSESVNYLLNELIKKKLREDYKK